MRRAISCVYWEPKSRTRILSCAAPIEFGGRLGFNLGPVVGGFLGDDHVVDVALPQTSLGDLNEAGLLLHLGDGAAPTVSHTGAQPADQLVHHSRERAAVRSEEHTSELQSQSNLVCRLLLEKKKTQQATVATPPT